MNLINTFTRYTFKKRLSNCNWPSEYIRHYCVCSNLNDARKSILSGLQPSGTVHLGNYLGAIKPIVKLQSSAKTSKLLLLIADLHALTSVSCPKTLFNHIQEMALVLMACGIDPIKSNELENGKTILFQQSAVHGHTQLAWILSCYCSHQRLAHLPQWRDKLQSKQQQQQVVGKSVGDRPIGQSVSLFTYPILQAADILLYGVDEVPVGEDQLAHIELARDLARGLDGRFPGLASLRVPEATRMGLSKVYSLRDPVRKMSKSSTTDADGGIVWLTDSADVINAKLKRAQTDSLPGVSYSPENRPGLANLIRLLAALQDRSIEDIADDCSRLSKSEVKSQVADAIVGELTPIQTRLADLLKAQQAGIDSVSVALEAGRSCAQEMANETLTRVYAALGLAAPCFSVQTESAIKRARS